MRLLSSLHLAIGVLVLTIGFGWYVDAQTDRIGRHHVRISTGLEQVQKYNIALSNLLAISVLERNILRAASYATLNAQLDAALSDVAALADALHLAGEIQPLREERTHLAQIESQALEHMRNDRWEDASRLLSDNDHQMARKIYEINTDTAVGALSGELDSLAGRFEQWRKITFGMRMGAILLLLWAGRRYSQRLHRELAEQGRLRKAVSAANAALEAKVRERTQALEAANAQLEALSATDGLTGLANRRKLDTTWVLTWKQALRQHYSVAVLLIDVDHFKAYNDHYGHPAGDVCLQRIGQVLRDAQRRAGELAGRYGGEEFMVLLPYADLAQAAATAERIRQQVQSAGMAHVGNDPLGVVTISIGVAACIPQGEQPAQYLIDRADQALYQAKEAGRNRVALAEVP